MNHSMKIFSGLFMVILLHGCAEHNHNCMLTELSTNGKVSTQKHIDTCSNVILEEQEFTRDASGKLIANGYRKIFYASGQLKNISYYNNGLQNYLYISYYENGLMCKKNYLIGDSAGHFFGAQYYYSKNNFVDSIENYSQYGEKWLTLILDKDRNVKSMRGNLMHITLSKRSPYFDSIPIKFPLFLMSEIAVLDGMKTELHINLKQNKLVFLDTTITDFKKIYNMYLIGLKHPFNKKGDYKFSATVTIKDSISGKEFMDTLSKNITVY